MKRKRPSAKSGGKLLPIWVIGGVVLLLILLVCSGGGAFGAYFLWLRDDGKSSVSA